MVWKWFEDTWLVTRQASILFMVSTLFVIALTPVLLGRIDTQAMSFWARLPIGILGLVGPVALFFLWFGVWRYWVRIDNAGKWVKRIWFLVLLVGFWWGSCLYYFVVYLPQVFRRTRGTT